MKRLFAFALIFIAFTALVVMPLGETVKAYEKNMIETLECDLVNIVDVNYEITQTVYPVMIVEVEISYGNYNYEQENINKEFKEINRYYSTTDIMYSDRLNSEITPDNNPKLRTNDDRLKFCKLYEEVGISAGKNQDRQHIT